MRFPADFLKELKARSDIEEVVSRYMDLSNRGTRNPKGLCPFHSEKTPSFTLYTDSQTYHCFGCHAGGDVITFVMNIERLDYSEAVKLLAQRAGIDVPEQNADEKKYTVRRRCLSANREAAKFYHHILSTPEGKAGADYFEGRKLTRETVTHFGLGYAPDKWDSLVRHMKKLGYTDEELVAFDLAMTTKNGGIIDRFRDRVMFPVIDLRGNVVAFTGRILTADKTAAKYVNTRGTVVYKKGDDIFGLNFAKNSNDGKLILVEGNMDVIAMHQAGFTNTVATMGTAFTKEQISLLSRYCKELYLCFDSDTAGMDATNKAIKQLASTNIDIRIIGMTGGKDADEILKTHGADYMRRLISGAKVSTEFGLVSLKNQFDTAADDGKRRYVEAAAKLLAGIKSNVERDIYLKRLSAETGVDERAIAAEIKKNANFRQRDDEHRKFESALNNLVGNSSLSPNPQAKQYPNAVRAEETLLATLLKSPDYLSKLGSSIHEDLFITDMGRKIFRDFSVRIKEGRTLETYDFSGGDDSAEISCITYLYAKADTVTNSISECDECIRRLIYEKNKTGRTNVAGMNDDEFMRAFNEAVRKNTSGGNQNGK